MVDLLIKVVAYFVKKVNYFYIIKSSDLNKQVKGDQLY
jgi:hypothetical protein